MSPQASPATNEEPWADLDELQNWLIGNLASRLGVDRSRLDPSERFHRFGLDSARAGGLVADLSAYLGRALPPTLVWDYPTVEKLCAFLVLGGTEPEAGPSAPRSPVGATMDIAVVGLACRFPSAEDPESYWRLLENGVDAIREVPGDRWDLESLYDPDSKAAGKMSTRWGGFLERVDAFDPQFFGISPREALQMDPQQRLFLELAWEALENAGIAADGLRGSRTGVFAGVMWNDYAKLLGAGLDTLSEHSATGQDTSIVPARVSYVLGLEGPSLAINTACSSSLVAVHTACQSLLRGDADMALAGGVHLVVSPHSTVSMTKFGAMAPDGRSKAFDHRANGYVRGEGGGLVVLKPLRDAVRDGERIWAVVRGGAINNDGFSNGLTAPNPKAQEAMLRDAYDGSGIGRSSVHYVETHGTGTLLGDPIEAGALGSVLGRDRDSEDFLRIGSVKTNFGHTEAAAGAAGLIKVLLSMGRRQLPPSLHFERPNPHIPFDAIGLKVQTELEPWPRRAEKALAGVSSFGFGGTNCHLVLEAPARARPLLLPLAAADRASLAAEARRVRALLDGSDEPLDGLIRSLRLRARGPYRTAVVVQDRQRAVEDLGGLVEFLTSEPGSERLGLPGVVEPGFVDVEGKGPVFVASGQGSEHAGMCKELLLTEPVFRAMMQRCDEIYRPLGGWSLIEELLEEEPRFADTGRNQPMLFAMQVALAELWRSWGVEPAVVVGHSAGELASAFLSGSLDLHQALEVAHHRGRLTQQTAGLGKMAVLDMSADEAREALVGREELLSVAVDNSPGTCVVAGDPEALAQWTAELARDRGLEANYVKVDYASHCPQMDSVLDELEASVAHVVPKPPELKVISTVTAEPIEDAGFDARYWRLNLRRPVRYADTLKALVTSGHSCFVELSGHPVLAKPTAQAVAAHGDLERAVVVPSMRRDCDEQALLMESLGRLWVSGRTLRWDAVHGPGEVASPAELAHWPEVDHPEPVSDPAPQSESVPGSVLVLPISARNAEALGQLARRYADALEAAPPASVVDWAHTAGVRRSHMEERAAIVFRHVAELRSGLKAVADSADLPAVVARGRKRNRVKDVPVFVFSGQGSQWPRMTLDLLAGETAFARELRRVDAAWQPVAGWSLIEELERPEGESRLGNTEVAQGTIFAVQLALAALWRSWGVEPAAVVGHSIGEAAAARVAGILSLEDAVTLVYHRGRAMAASTGRGGRMAQVELPLADVELYLEEEPTVSLAAVNGPSSVVIAGDGEVLDGVVDRLDADGVTVRPLRVDYAFHSHHMDAALPELELALAGLEPLPGEIPMVSTVTAEPVDGTALDAAYWCRNVRSTVRFSEAVARLAADGADIFVEVSPHPVLAASLEQILEAAAATDAGQEDRVSADRALVVSGPRRPCDRASTGSPMDGPSQMAVSLARLYVAGLEPHWPEVNPAGRGHVDLPTYPWQRRRYWLPDELPAGRSRRLDHPWLGEHLTVATVEPRQIWQRPLDLPYLADHQLRQSAVFPAAGYLSAAWSAAEASGWTALEIHDVSFTRALSLPDVSPGSEGLRAVVPSLQTILEVEGASAARFRCAAVEEAPGDESPEPALHARGRLRRNPAPSQVGSDPRRMVELGSPSSGAEHYARMASRGLIYGPSFRAVDELWLADGRAVGRLTPTLEDTAYACHPTLLDGLLQLLEAALSDEISPPGTLYLPAAVERLRAWEQVRGEVFWGTAVLRPGAEPGARRVVGDLQLFDADYRLLLEMQGAAFERVGEGVEPAAEGSGADLGVPLWQTRWAVDEAAVYGPLPETEALPPAAPDSWVVLTDSKGVGEKLIASLRAAGRRVLEVAAGDAFLRSREHLMVAPRRREHLFWMLEEASRGVDGPLGVVHLWSLDADPGPDAMSEDLSAAYDLGVISALHLTRALASGRAPEVPGGPFWVTAGATSLGKGRRDPGGAGALWGLAQTWVLEEPRPGCRLVDLDLANAAGTADARAAADALLREIVGAFTDSATAAPALSRAAWSEGRRFTPELAPAVLRAGEPVLEAPGDRAFRLGLRRPGSLDHLRFEEVAEPTPGPGQVVIDVKAAGLNFRDVLKALDMYPGLDGPPMLGDECAGVISAVGEGVTDLARGDSVMALADHALAGRVVAEADLVLPKPESLSFEQAAGQLLTYLTAHYAFDHVARLQRGEKVLIHAAAGGVGLAAVNLARRLDAEIFGTAGSEHKRDYLRSVGVAHALDSRSLSFVDGIREATGGEGVDVVLNSLAGEAVPASLSVLGKYGRFLEIGKRDIYADRPLGLEPFQRNLTYAAIDVDPVFRERPALARRLLAEVVAMLAGGEVAPLPVEVFPAAQVVDAFHHMAQAKHVGKIVIATTDRQTPIMVPRARRSTRSGTWLITGGFGGLGLAVASRLADRGAQRLALAGRRGAPDEVRPDLDALRARGVRVEEIRMDVTRADEVDEVVRALAAGDEPLRGVIHAAGVLDDGVLSQLDRSRFFGPAAVKMAGAWNLHRATRDLSLDAFVLFSSVTSVLGSPGQANYAAANAGLDSLASYRRAAGLPAVSVQWGPWNEVGMAQRSVLRGERLAQNGLAGMDPADALDALERVLDGDAERIMAAHFDASAWLRAHPSAAGPFLRSMANGTDVSAVEAAGPVERLRDAAPEERPAILLDHLRSRVVEVLRLGDLSVDASTPLRALGLDSLMGVELRNRLEADLQVRLSAGLVWNYPTLELMVPHLLSRLEAAGELTAEKGTAESTGATSERTELPRVSKPAAESFPDPGHAIAEAVEAMSEEDAEARLLAELEALEL